MHHYCYSELITKVCFLSVMEIFSSYSSKVNITLIVLTLTDIYSATQSSEPLNNLSHVHVPVILLSKIAVVFWACDHNCGSRVHLQEDKTKERPYEQTDSLFLFSLSLLSCCIQSSRNSWCQTKGRVEL